MDRQEALEMMDRLAKEAGPILSKIGLSYRLKDSSGVYYVPFNLVGVSDDLQYGVLQVDTGKLPPRVKVSRIVNKDSLHQLTACTGRRWRKLNTTGATLCVDFNTVSRKRLPTRVLLPDVPDGEYMIPIGQGRRQAVWRSTLETSHILVGGESRSGKSTWLNAMLFALLRQHSADQLNLALFDPKGVEFIWYQDLPHLMAEIAIEPVQAAELIKAVEAEMDRRQHLFQTLIARNLSIYNERAVAYGIEPLPLILVCIDEATDISMQAGDDFQRPLLRLASKGASFGIVLILSTQYPKFDILDTKAKGNLSVRIAFRCASADHSRTILGQGGAEKIPRTIRGRMKTILDIGQVDLQGFYVPEEYLVRFTNKLRGYDIRPEKSAQAPPPQETPAAPRLTTLQCRLAQFAIEELDGSFAVNRLYEVDFVKIGFQWRELLDLARRWEDEGLLAPPVHKRASRTVTPELEAIAYGD